MASLHPSGVGVQAPAASLARQAAEIERQVAATSLEKASSEMSRLSDQVAALQMREAQPLTLLRKAIQRGGRRQAEAWLRGGATPDRSEKSPIGLSGSELRGNR
jgi:hypothetical protein